MRTAFRPSGCSAPTWLLDDPKPPATGAPAAQPPAVNREKGANRLGRSARRPLALCHRQVGVSGWSHRRQQGIHPWRSPTRSPTRPRRAQRLAMGSKSSIPAALATARKPLDAPTSSRDLAARSRTSSRDLAAGSPTSSRERDSHRVPRSSPSSCTPDGVQAAHGTRRDAPAREAVGHPRSRATSHASARVVTNLALAYRVVPVLCASR